MMFLRYAGMVAWAIAASIALVSFTGSSHAQASNACKDALEISAIDGLLKSIAARLPKDDILSDSDLKKLQAIVVSKLTNSKGAIVDVVHLRALKSKDLKAYPEYKTINVFVGTNIEYDPAVANKDDPWKALGGNISGTLWSFPSFEKLLENDHLISLIEIRCYVAN